MALGALPMPSHPPERSIRDGQREDLKDLERLDALGFGEAWIGVVYRADQTCLKRTVALKMIRPAFSLDEGEVARFRQEAEAEICQQDATAGQIDQ
jgi:hypothetical protein